MELRKAIMLVAPLALALLAPSGAAQAPRGNGPCRQDIERLCPGVKAGGGAFRDCLKQHATELSPACQDRLKQMKTQLETWRQACQDDVQKFCAQVEPGRGNIKRCLHQHHDQLSHNCQERIAQHRRRHKRDAQTPTPGGAPSGQ